MTEDVLAAGRAFIERKGRLVERRSAEMVLDGADPALALERRGIQTVRALLTLRAYGRIG